MVGEIETAPSQCCKRQRGRSGRRTMLSGVCYRIRCSKIVGTLEPTEMPLCTSVQVVVDGELSRPEVTEASQEILPPPRGGGAD